jgi:hypothetical protein
MGSPDGGSPASAQGRVALSGGKRTLVDGPLAEAKDLLAGFTVLQVKSRAEALEWARRWPALDGDGVAQLELRLVFEADEVGAAFTPELRQAEERLGPPPDRPAGAPGGRFSPPLAPGRARPAARGSRRPSRGPGWPR